MDSWAPAATRSSLMAELGAPAGEGESAEQPPAAEQGSSCLIDAPWAAALVHDSDNVLVMNASDLMLGKTPLTPDHLFTAFLKTGLLEDLLSLYNRPLREVHSLFHLGRDVCGHPELTHGGLITAMQDETWGILVYMLKHHGHLPRGPAFTARLEVDFKKPIPAGKVVLCRTWVESIEGRKVWLRSQVRDGPEGDVYSEGKSLFVTKVDAGFDHMASSRGSGGAPRPSLHPALEADADVPNGAGGASDAGAAAQSAAG